MSAHTADDGRAVTLDGVQQWYRSKSPQITTPHACVLFDDRGLLESYANTFVSLAGVKLFKLAPRINTEEKLKEEEVVTWRNRINICNKEASSVDLFITLVHYGVVEAASKHALFGVDENEKKLSRKFTSLHVFARNAVRQELIYKKLSRVTKWHKVFTSDFFECGLPKDSPRTKVRSCTRQQVRRRVARPSDVDFHERRKEFNSQRALALQLGQRADDLFVVNNLALTRRCIGQQIWEQYRRWYRETTSTTSFYHTDTFECFRSECEASLLLSSSRENPYSERSVAPEPLLTVADAVAEMRKAEMVDHWLAHLYRLEIDFLTQKMGHVLVNHEGVCDAVLQRVAGNGGAAETSHALFSLAIGTTMPLTPELVANACSGIHLIRKVNYETNEGTKELFKSPHRETHKAMPMEVDGNSGADVGKKRRASDV